MLPFLIFDKDPRRHPAVMMHRYGKNQGKVEGYAQAIKDMGAADRLKLFEAAEKGHGHAADPYGHLPKTSDGTPITEDAHRKYMHYKDKHEEYSRMLEAGPHGNKHKNHKHDHGRHGGHRRASTTFDTDYSTRTHPRMPMHGQHNAHTHAPGHAGRVRQYTEVDLPTRMPPGHTGLGRQDARPAHEAYDSRMPPGHGGHLDPRAHHTRAQYPPTLPREYPDPRMAGHGQYPPAMPPDPRVAGHGQYPAPGGMGPGGMAHGGMAHGGMAHGGMAHGGGTAYDPRMQRPGEVFVEEYGDMPYGGAPQHPGMGGSGMRGGLVDPRRPPPRF